MGRTVLQAAHWPEEGIGKHEAIQLAHLDVSALHDKQPVKVLVHLLTGIIVIKVKIVVVMVTFSIVPVAILV